MGQRDRGITNKKPSVKPYSYQDIKVNMERLSYLSINTIDILYIRDASRPDYLFYFCMNEIQILIEYNLCINSIVHFISLIHICMSMTTNLYIVNLISILPGKGG